jgi:ankyrin repeat protein/beta-lactamase regulating signal transducer with metallopeptidase domain
MNYINDLVSSELINALGWTLLHSLWQGALIGFVLAIVLLLMKRFTAQTRYYMTITAMLTMLALSVFTFADLYQPASPKEISKITPQTMLQEETVNPGLPLNVSTANPDIVQTSSIESFRRTFLRYFDRHMPSIVTLWFLGMLIFLLKFLGGLAYTQRLKHYRIQPVAENWQDKVTLLCQKLNIERAVTALKSGVVRVPMVIGYLRPVILLPGSLFTGLTPQQIESILAHELAHIARHDYLLNLIQSMIEVVYFYHPAVWWISSCLRSEREHCCDDIAVKICGDSHTFARTLADLQEKYLESNVLAMALTGSRNKLFQRIHRLVNQPKIKSSFGEGFFTALIIIVCLTVVAFSMKNSPKSVPSIAENARTDSTLLTEPQEQKSQELLDDPYPVAQEPAKMETQTKKLTEAISDPSEDEAPPPPAAIFEAATNSMDSAAQQMKSVSKQMSKQEKKVYQDLLDLKKQERQVRSKSIDEMKDQMKNLQEALRTYEPSSLNWDNDVLLEGFDSPGLPNSLAVPLPIVIPEVGADWLVTGGNKLIAAVNSGNIDSVRARLSESDVNAGTPVGWTALMEAAKKGNAEIVKLLLEHGADLESRSKEGRTALWIAVYYGNSEVIKVLLAHNVDINTKDNDGYTPLIAAIINNQTDAADVLLADGVDINISTFKGETALTIAVAKKSSIAYRLIDKGAPINKTDNTGQSPLLLALKNGWIDMASRLVEKDADVNFKSPEGDIPLFYAIRQRQILLAKLLIKHGADVNAKNNQGETPLLMALDYKLYDLVDNLLDNSADVNISDHEGNSPLFIAIERRLHTLAQHIIDKKADLNKKNVQGDSPLHYALYFNMNEIARLLIQKNADLNINNREGLSPLALALSDDKIELAHLMLTKGANPDVKSKEGIPIILAALNDGLTETAKLLIDKGADINVTTADGTTPLLMAIDEHYIDISRILIEKGADVNRKDSQNRTALLLADENELYEISALLKSKGAKQ